MTNEEERPVTTDPAEQLQGLACLHATGEQGVELQEIALRLAHLPERQLGGFASARLGTCKDRPERNPHAGQRNTCDARLVAATLGQLPLRVRTGAVRLCVGVTEQPELTGHSHCVLRA